MFVEEIYNCGFWRNAHAHAHEGNSLKNDVIKKCPPRVQKLSAQQKISAHAHAANE